MAGGQEGGGGPRVTELLPSPPSPRGPRGVRAGNLDVRNVLTCSAYFLLELSLTCEL